MTRLCLSSLAAGKPTAFSPAAVGLFLASGVLAYEPLHWLVGTWLDPSYPTSGAVYLIALFGLLLWSLTSPVVRSEAGERHRRGAVGLLAVSALIRLAGQVLAVNVVGGLALGLDVFALAVLLRTGARARPVSALWLAVLFLFTLPVERILQRIAGYPLQSLSADLSCGLLGIFFDDLSCSGVRLQLAGQDVLVDLPCSGTAGLMLSLAFVTILHALYRPRLMTAMLWTAAALASAITGNALRISLLAVGLGYPDSMFGLNVMAEPVHSLIGYLTLGLSLAPVFLFYRPNAVPASKMTGGAPAGAVQSADFTFPVSGWMRGAAALGFLGLALVIVNLPRQAFDVSSPVTSRTLPAVIGGEAGVVEPLLPVEQTYLTQFGGHAEKRRYGPLALTLVQTSSPLRHLHAPDDCLRGLGYRMEFLGTRMAPVPTALYRASSAEGRQWRVAVSFVSDRGHITNNIAEAIWLWLQEPKTAWTSIQRITPWQMPEDERKGLEASVATALDLPREVLVEKRSAKAGSARGVVPPLPSFQTSEAQPSADLESRHQPRRRCVVLSNESGARSRSRCHLDSRSRDGASRHTVWNDGRKQQRFSSKSPDLPKPDFPKP
ncbi:exosortase T [uncultured Roseibium sp.]|uniref:exosortase T n=1 Tax=uncultured Roseibium sp. TaxID=1936171 RepID=UPI003217B7D8